MAGVPGVTGTGPDLLPDDLARRGLAAEPETHRRAAISDAAVFTMAVYTGQALVFLAGLIQKGVLGPAATGYWALMQTFWTFLAIAPLGAFQGASRQIPAHRGRGDYEAAAATADTGSAFSVTAMGVAGPVLAAVALLFGGDWAPELRYGLVILGLMAPLRQLSISHEVIFQATKRFKAASMTEIVQAAVVLTVQTLFVVLFGFYGMFMGLAASIVAAFVLWERMGLISWRKPAFRWRIDGGRIRELISFGVPILIHGQIWLLFMAVDGLIVAGFIDVKSLGYYSLALSVTTYILLLPKSLGAVLFPRMAERFGKTKDVGAIRHYVTDLQGLLGYTLVPGCMGAVFFLVPVLIRHALPEFEPGISVVRIVVAGSFFLALTNMPIKLLIAAGYRWSLTAVTASCLGFNAAANYVAVGVLDQGIDGAAFATAISYFVVFLAMTGYGLSKVLSVRQLVAHVGELILIFAYSIAALWGIELALGAGADRLVDDVLLGAAKLGIFLVVLTPWFVLGQIRYRGPAMIWSLLLSGGRALRRVRAGTGTAA